MVPQNLSPAERRVLESFYCGRLSAGSLNAALAAARREQPRRATASPQPQGVPALRLAA